MATMRGERALRQYKRWAKRKTKTTSCSVNFTNLDLSKPSDLDCMFLYFKNLTFKNCNFSNWQHLPHFENCNFENCDFSYSRFCYDLTNCSFKDCNFNKTSFSFCSLMNIEINGNENDFIDTEFIATIIENCQFFGQNIEYETNYYKDD